MSSYKLRPAKAFGVMCLETASGTPVGTVGITESGKFKLWLNRKVVGEFSTMGLMCRAVDRLKS